MESVLIKKVNKIVQKNQRKNRPKKKELNAQNWGSTLQNLQRSYAYGGKEKQKEQPPVQPSEEE